MTDRLGTLEGVRAAGRWSRTLDLLHDLDPAWTEAYAAMATDPWTNGALSAKDIQLIATGLNAAITTMDPVALRRHVRAALQAGATKAEILEVVKMAAVVALHSMSLGAPILLEEAAAAGAAHESGDQPAPATPSCDTLKALGQWNRAWDPFFDLDPRWTEAFVSAGTGFYTSGVLTPKFVELVSIAFDASITHMYAPGTRRHIKAALALGASCAEILDVLKLCVSMGANALDAAVPILAEEAAAFEEAANSGPDFIEAAALADCAPGRSTTVAIEGKQIAHFNVGGSIFATDDSCPHAGSSLGWGVLDGTIVRCRSHGLRFDVETGKIVGGGELAVKTYETRVDGDKISIRLNSPPRRGQSFC